MAAKNHKERKYKLHADATTEKEILLITMFVVAVIIVIGIVGQNIAESPTGEFTRRSASIQNATNASGGGGANQPWQEPAQVRQTIQATRFASFCGDGIVTGSEQCDWGPYTNIPCTPPVGGACIWCTSDCKLHTYIGSVQPTVGPCGGGGGYSGNTSNTSALCNPYLLM